jgi:hypothetical protein
MVQDSGFNIVQAEQLYLVRKLKLGTEQILDDGYCELRMLCPDALHAFERNPVNGGGSHYARFSVISGRAAKQAFLTHYFIASIDRENEPAGLHPGSGEFDKSLFNQVESVGPSTLGE